MPTPGRFWSGSKEPEDDQGYNRSLQGFYFGSSSEFDFVFLTLSSRRGGEIVGVSESSLALASAISDNFTEPEEDVAIEEVSDSWVSGEPDLETELPEPEKTDDEDNEGEEERKWRLKEGCRKAKRRKR